MAPALNVAIFRASIRTSSLIKGRHACYRAGSPTRYVCGPGPPRLPAQAGRHGIAPSGPLWDICPPGTPGVGTLAGRMFTVKTVTPRMRDALKNRGFTRDGHVWRLDRPVLPALIYQDKNPWGPYFGLGVSLGGPGERQGRNEGGVVTVGQRLSAGEPMFYDFGKPEEAQALCERDFFAVTIPLIDLTAPDDLARALLQGRFQSVHFSPRPEGSVYAALEVADAYGLEGLMPEIAQRLHEVTRDPDVYDQVVGTARSHPDRIPRLAGMIAAIPSPPTPPPDRTPSRTPRWFGLRRRPRHGGDD